ncbi:MAG: nitroreductase family protein [Eubacteriales bacterium]
MIELLCYRRSTRRFKSKKIEKDKIKKLEQAALLSPTSRNIRPWEFVVVQDATIIGNLSKSKKHGSDFLKDAPLAFVIIADSTKSDVWIEDTSIASIIIQLEVEKLGLGSCWVQIRNRFNSEGETSEEYVKKVLNIPKQYKVLSIIGIGYKDEQRSELSLEELDYSKIHYEKF